ncbi:hypothetical protein [Halobiforma nitratireducens]|uniref:hypothetical protein n=1 Tax=Halobiforma nitratireducens TaxID=130048 RepID=UPI000ADE27D6|nr:hypothetical protein [Halobiforma nitratireducens]
MLRERPTMEHVLLLSFLFVGLYMYRGAGEFAPAAQTFPRLMAGGTILLSVLLLARNYLRIAGPLVGAVLGVYLLYGGMTTYTGEGEFTAQLIGGFVLLAVALVFRERFGAAVESFVAESVQVMGDDGTPVDESTAEGDGPDAAGTDPTDPATDELESEPTPTAEEPKRGERVEHLEADESAETAASDVDTDVDQPDATDDETDSEAMYTYDIDDPRGPVVTALLCVGYMGLTFTIGMLYATPIFVAAWALWARMDAARGGALVVLSFAVAYAFYDLIQDDIAVGWLTGWELPPPDELLELLGLSAHAADALGIAVRAAVIVL